MTAGADTAGPSREQVAARPARVPPPPPTGLVRGPQSLLSGAVLVALALAALWFVRDLPQGTLRAMGPSMLPRVLAIAVGYCGLGLVASGIAPKTSIQVGIGGIALGVLFGLVTFVAPALLPVGVGTAILIAVAGLIMVAAGLLSSGELGSPLETFTIRGPVVVLIAILIFGVAIRGFDFGAFSVPTLGLMIAGPLAIFTAGLATPEARVNELAILALALTAACMMLFGDLLNLPIPMYPQAFSDLYPAGWSSDARLRTTSAVMAVLAAAVWAATFRSHRGEPVDVVSDEHAGQV